MSNIAIVIGLLSVVSATVKEIEARSEAAIVAGEKTWTGEFKLALALSVIEQVYNQTKPTVSFETIKATLTSAIATIVAVFNALGQFRKSLKTA